MTDHKRHAMHVLIWPLGQIPSGVEQAEAVGYVLVHADRVIESAGEHAVFNAVRGMSFGAAQSALSDNGFGWKIMGMLEVDR